MSDPDGPLARLRETAASLVDRVTGSRGAPVTVVSGLPRSGTSMMMQMLEAGGIDPLTDHEREPDEDNPEGYYEYERVKKLEDGDTDWLPKAEGKAVKVVSALLEHLPEGYDYRVVFMRRRIDEVLASQAKMLERRGEDPDEASEEELKELFLQHVRKVERWAEDEDDVDLLFTHYNDVVDDPYPQLERVDAFLGGGLDVDAMARVVDPDLYRNRA